LQPEHTGRSGEFQLFRTGNAGLGEPVASNHQLAVLPHPIRPQILPVLAGLAQRFPGGFVGDGGDPQGAMLARQLQRGASGKSEPGQRSLNFSFPLNVGETGVISDINVTRVGRWMSSDELAQIQNGGAVVQGAGGQTFVSTNGALDYKPTALNGSVYVEFDVPTNSLLQGGNEGWFKLIGPDANRSQQFLLNKQGGTQLPPFYNISVKDSK